MILYTEADIAPNPRRVHIFLAEKGIAIRQQRLSLRKGEHKSPEHLARNSLGQVPVLELEDGTCISESISICRYLDALHPDPPLFGDSPLDRAKIDMALRRVEFQLMAPVGLFWAHAHPLTAKLVRQHPEFGESNRARYDRIARWLDAEMADGRPHIAGEAFTIADIAALTTIDFATFIGLPLPEDCARLLQWHGRVMERPSTKAA